MRGDVDDDVTIGFRVSSRQLKQTDAEDAQRAYDNVHHQTQTKCYAHLKFNTAASSGA